MPSALQCRAPRTSGRLPKMRRERYLPDAAGRPARNQAALPEYKSVHSQVLQMTLRRLDNAFQGFFRRVKTGQAPGFPRFQGRNRFDSFCYPQYAAKVATDARHVYLPKIGNVRIRLHRPIEGRIKTATVKREGSEWYLVFVAEVETKTLPPTGSEAGIDLGLQHLSISRLRVRYR
ncbi:RNA-guided endonuclease InsQ/TnpB family protein [Coleofasciculus sp. H7-2]|uniref:RNA-guided endonuclease InsQ/TnpB family protein n=1 Tax=Coleofasciculus sp. H7-2 TaxID=3351545 RepID=UPI0036722687